MGVPHCACAYFYRFAASDAKREKEIVAATDFGTILAGHIFHRIRKREWNAQTRAPTKQEKKPWRL